MEHITILGVCVCEGWVGVKNLPGLGQKSKTKIRYGLNILFSVKSEIESMLAGLEAFLHVLLLGDTQLW